MVIIEGYWDIQINKRKNVYHWDGQLTEIGAISIPDYVEANSNRLRDKYLNFINDIGGQTLGRCRVNDELLLYKGHSLWWMSTIVEKNLVKTPAISDCIKLLALEEILIRERPSQLEIYTNNSDVLKSIRGLVKTLNIQIVVSRCKSGKPLIERFKDLVPLFVKGIFYLIKQHGICKDIYKENKIDWHSGDKQVFIFSHLINFDLPESHDSSIYSRYWETLPAFLNKRNIKMNFLDHFHFSKKVQNVKQGIELVKSINLTSSSHGEIHHLMPIVLNIHSLIEVFKFFIFVHICKWKMYQVQKIFKPKNSSVTFWFLLRKEWRTSMLGIGLLENLLFIESIEYCLKSLPKQNLGLFLQENSSWEKAFIVAWRKYQEAELIGVAHTVIRYWDLRYYEKNPVSSTQSFGSKVPLPDYIAVNGPVAELILMEAGYDANKIVKVEALRYLSSTICKPFKTAKSGNKNLKVLVCGDIDIASTTNMLDSLRQLLESLQNGEGDYSLELTYKSHPVNDLDLKAFGLGEIAVTTESISSIIETYDIAIVTDSTTAGVEAYLAGLNVIVFSYPKRLNFSPLRNVKNVNFVSNSKQLADCLKKIPISDYLENKEVFFWNDPNLSKWNQVFSHYYNYN